MVRLTGVLGFCLDATARALYRRWSHAPGCNACRARSAGLFGRLCSTCMHSK